ncbi:MAG TPA: sodium:solute symporter, partial [Flavobacteriales bacterium]|nr:sodium:solute symporter [Flavobacteriales bacterium]
MLLGFVILYMVFTVAMGFFASRFISSSTDFVQAGRRLPAFFNATALFALWFGSETVFGASSRFMEEGLIGVVEDPFGGVLCLLLFAIFFVRKLYRLNMLTIGDLFERAYGKRVEVVSSVFMLITFFGYIAAQLIALAIILKSVTGLETEYGIVLCAVIVTGYTFVGGMWAVSITDF